MSSAVGFLVFPLLAAIIGSVALWAWSRRRPNEPTFSEQLSAIAPDPQSRPAGQPSGIVRLEDTPVEEN